MNRFYVKRAMKGNIALVLFIAFLATFTFVAVPQANALPNSPTYNANLDPDAVLNGSSDAAVRDENNSFQAATATVGASANNTVSFTIQVLTDADWGNLGVKLFKGGQLLNGTGSISSAVYNNVYGEVYSVYQFVYTFVYNGLTYQDGYSLGVYNGDTPINSITLTLEAPPPQEVNHGGGGGGGGATPASTTHNVTASRGGTITDTGKGITISIPANAIAADVKVTVTKVASTVSIAPAGEAKFVSDVLEIIKDKSGNFDKPVTISLSYDKSKVDTSKFDLKVCWYNEETKAWVPLDGITVDSASGKVSGQVTHFTKFAVIAFPKEALKPEVKPVALTDIKGSWAEANIVKLVGMEAIAGYPDGTFKPNNSISRAEFCSVLVKALKLDAKSGKVFSDTASHWAKDAISTAAAYGIVSGMSDTTFAPDANITREQMAVMIVKAAKVAKTTGGKDFADKAKISSWAKDAVAAASDNQIINGYPDNTFKPQGLATRAEAATVIVKIIK